MSNKFALKVIQQGQTQKIHTLTPGAGMAGQGLTLQASDGVRYQLNDIVTLNSPAKLQLKRVGNKLHLALPGGDIDAPDLVIDDYFSVKNASLWGNGPAGEWMGYDTTPLAGPESAFTARGAAEASKMVQVSLDTPGTSVMGFVQTPLGLGAVAGGAGVLALVAGASGGGGGSSSAESKAAAVIKGYAASDNNTEPKLTDYTAYGVKAYASLTDTSDDSRVALSASNTNLSAINSAIEKLNRSDITLERVQDLVDAYYRILQEADGNTSTDTDVYVDLDHDPDKAKEYDDPTAQDYANVGATVGSTHHSLALLNDVVGRSGSSQVDSVDEINAMARAAENVMLQAQGASAGASGGPAIYTTDDEWAAGLRALGFSGITARMMADIKTALAATADDGTGVDTYDEIKELINPIVAAHTLRSYAVASSNTKPSLQTYKDAGIKALSSLGEATASADIDNVGSTVGGASAWLASLNSALEKWDPTDSDAATVEAIKGKVQALADAYYRILSEADGNSDTDTDVYASNNALEDPQSADYAAIGVTVGAAIGSKTLDLLNDAVGRLGIASVDTADEVQALATTANDVMLLAKEASASQTDAKLIAGLNALLGISSITTTNLAAVKKAITDTDDSGTGVDTVEELQTLVKAAIALQTLKDFTNDSAAIGNKTATAPSLATYTDLGIQTFKSLADTSTTSRKELGDSSTANLAESNTFLTAAVLNSAIDRLAGDGTLDKAKVQTLVDAYYRILKEADGDSTSNKDVYADGTTEGAKAAAFNDPTLADYTAIGVTVDDAIDTDSNPNTTDYVGTPSGTANLGGGSGNETLNLLNDAVGRLQTSAVDSAEEVQTLATTANDVMRLAKVDTVVSTTNTQPVIDENIKGAATQTDAKLIDGLNALLGLNTSTGVNSNNLSAIKAAIAGTDNSGAGADTVPELQSLLSLVRLKVFTEDTGNYFVSSANNTKTTSLPTLSDWSNAGVEANISLSDGTRVSLDQAAYWTSTNPVNGLMALNSALDTYAGSSVNEAVLQDIANSYGRILQAADGSRATETSVANVTNPSSSAAPVKADLVNVGVTGSSIDYLKTGDLLASAIGVLGSTAVDTVQELNTLAGYAEALMKHAAEVPGGNGYSDAQWFTAFSGLGITGVSSSNLADIKTAIATSDNNVSTEIPTINSGAGIDTWDELQAIVSMARLDDFAKLEAGYQTPVIGDHQAIAAAQNPSSDAFNTLKSAYLGAYNSVIDAKVASAGSAADVAAMLSAYTKLLNLADGMNNVDVNLTDDELNAIFTDANSFRIQGLGSSTLATTVADTFSDIADQLTTDKLDTVQELVNIGGVLNKLFTLAATSPSPDLIYNLTQSDLGLLGLKGQGNVTASFSSVTDNEMRVFCNQVLATADNGAGINSFAELQDLLNNAVLTG